MTRFAHLNIHFPIVRPQTRTRWGDCFKAVERAMAQNHAQGMPSFLTTDHNEWDNFPKPHPKFRKIGGEGIDLIGYVPVLGVKLDVLTEKTVNLTIDKHNAYGVKVRLGWPASGETVTFWLVQANLGRGEPAHEFTLNAERLRKAYPGKSSSGYHEIDEADRPREHELLRDAYPKYQLAGWGTTSPIVIDHRLDLRRVAVKQACDGLAKFTPHRPLVEAIIRVN